MSLPATQVALRAMQALLQRLIDPRVSQPTPELNTPEWHALWGALRAQLNQRGAGTNQHLLALQALVDDAQAELAATVKPNPKQE